MFVEFQSLVSNGFLIIKLIMTTMIVIIIVIVFWVLILNSLVIHVAFDSKRKSQHGAKMFQTKQGPHGCRWQLSPGGFLNFFLLTRPCLSWV